MTALSAVPVHGTEYVEGEVLVAFKKNTSVASVKAALGGHALALTKHFGLLSAQRGQHFGLVRAKDKTTVELIASLKLDPMVETVEPNYKRWINSGVHPNDTLFGLLWGLRNTAQTVNSVTGTAGDDIGFQTAWSLARPSGSNVVVAVIDTGADSAHPDLVGNLWVNHGEIPNNGLDDDGNGYVDDYYGYDFADGTNAPTDSGYHGTHVFGTIAAVGDNYAGVIGVDYQAHVMVLKVSSDGESISSDAEIDAIQYATMMNGRGAGVVAINASFGGGGFSSIEQAAIQSAGNAGIIFCAAAGNDSANNDVTLTYPAAYRLSNMIVVAATDQNDALASFSNYGATTVDLGAPGVNILSTLPTWLAGTTAYVQNASTTYAASELLYSGLTTGITATIYNCGLGGYASNFPAAVSNNIALIQRGSFYFSEKVANAMAAGARAAIIYNNVSGSYQGLSLQTASNWIPAVAISDVDGAALLATLPATGTVYNYTDPSIIYQYLDGTSMATPHVVGAVAFAAMNFPSETVTQRIQRILSNVDVVSGLSGKVRTGGRLNLKRTVDSDNNGLPDWWEQLYFNHQTGDDPNADSDQDGLNNIGEWVAGTSPTNPVSVFKFTSASEMSGQGIVVRWPSISNRFYDLSRATNILAGTNAFIIMPGASNMPATPVVNSYTDTVQGLGPFFYKIGVHE